MLDFAETGRGGAEVLQNAEAAGCGSNPSPPPGIANLRTVLDLLESAGVPGDRFAIDLGLARGLDYYTGIVFETTVNGCGRSSAASPTGSRYDNLASSSRPGGCRASAPRSGWTGSWP